MAAESLGNFSRDGASALDPLMERLSDESIEVRRLAVLSLGRLGKGRPKVEDALKHISSDPDPLIKLNALVALATLGHMDESSIPILLEAINNKQEATAKAAGIALTKVAVEKPDNVLPGLIELLDKKENPGIINSLRILTHMKNHAAPAVQKVAALYDGAKQPEKIEIVDTLSAIDTTGDYAIPVLMKALKEPDPLDREDALTMLMRYKSRADLFIDGLLGALNDPETKNRMLAVGIVRGLGQEPDKVVPQLVPLCADPDLRVRSAAISAISSFKKVPPSGVDAIEKSLNDADFRVRAAAATALARISILDREKAFAALQSALDKETNQQAKREILSALNVMRRNTSQSTH
ncbi:HEAT repeat-containing protein [Desulfomonile tiedjei DSM 6799]|uniref:HEAT repeat-containing protein n=2 Tax=Desulfomonile tiedjei TaxID=2358 RepID=I4C3K9_DESTA|nr:HEAT repeat-containing protein [Desulfomonile tiedjei DSM 6799]